MENQPRLYIIMRKDLQDMNPGKGMAQAAHAADDFRAYIDAECGPDFRKTNMLWEKYTEWKEDRNFGVTLVLHETLETMHEIQGHVRFADKTVDPTFPWRNHYGDVFLTEEVTCMWAFVFEADEIEYMQQFKLHL